MSHGPTIDQRFIAALRCYAALAAAFARFRDLEWSRETDQAQALRAFAARQAWWLEDYALFRAIHASQNERPWTDWPEPLRLRDAAAIDHAGRELAVDHIPAPGED